MMTNALRLTSDENTRKAATLKAVCTGIKSQRAVSIQTVMTIKADGFKPVKQTIIPPVSSLIVFPSCPENFSTFLKSDVKKKVRFKNLPLRGGGKPIRLRRERGIGTLVLGEQNKTDLQGERGMNNVKQVRPSGRVANAYFRCLAPFQCIMGPVGSGKSTDNIMKILSLAMFQPKDPHDGVRRSRFAVIRNTKTQLKQTTIKTFHDYIPESYGRYRENNGSISHDFSLMHDDGSRADVEILFIPLDKEEDIQRLLSLELTAAFINEAREVPGGLINSLYARTGRYPSVANGGCYWNGVLMDTNSFDVDNWIYKRFVEKPTEGWAFFRQPSGLSEEAENKENLIPHYYENLCCGATQEWVDMYVHAKFGYSRDGKPVFGKFSDHIHVGKEVLRPISGLKIQMGFDAGRTPACVFAQTLANGQKRILAEFFLEKTGPVEFSQKLLEFIGQRFGGFDADFSGKNWADPAAAMGDSDTDPSWINTVQNGTGFKIFPCPGDNAIGPRLDAVNMLLSELIDGEPAFILSPDCSVLRKGFNSGYCYKRMRSSSGETFEDIPDKNKYSHLMDALQYLCLGDGGYEKATGFKRNAKSRGVVQTRSDFKIFRR